LLPVLSPQHRKEATMLGWVWCRITRVARGLEHPKRGDFERAGVVQLEGRRTGVGG